MTVNHALRLKEAAARLGLSYRTLQRWVQELRIGSIRYSERTVRIPESEVERLLKEHWVPPFIKPQQIRPFR